LRGFGFGLGPGFCRFKTRGDKTFQTIQKRRTAQRPTRTPVFAQIPKVFLRDRTAQKCLPVADHGQYLFIGIQQSNATASRGFCRKSGLPLVGLIALLI